MMFAGDVRCGHPEAGVSLVPIILAGFGGLFFCRDTHVRSGWARLMAFMHPDQYQGGAGYQQYQGMIAFGSGGVEWSSGWGLGRQKMSYLPFAYTDFILPVIGERNS